MKQNPLHNIWIMKVFNKWEQNVEIIISLVHELDDLKQQKGIVW